MNIFFLLVYLNLLKLFVLLIHLVLEDYSIAIKTYYTNHIHI